MSGYNALMRRLRVLLDRGVLRRADYAGKVRVMQVSMRPGTVLDGVEHLEPYGWTSHPLAGCEQLVGNLGGNSGRAVVIISSDRRHRIVIDEGEVAIYHHTGDFVHLKNGGEIHVKAASKVFVETPLVECSQNLHVLGNITVDGTAQIQGAVTMLNTLNVAMSATLQAGLSVAGNTTSTGNFTTSGQVVAGGVSLRSHTHSGVQSGGSNTGGPA